MPNMTELTEFRAGARASVAYLERYANRTP
jgi:hypothetical protein